MSKDAYPFPYPTRISLSNLALRFQNCLRTEINCISDPKAVGEDFLSDTLISECAPSEQTMLTNTAWIVNMGWTYFGEPNNHTRLSTDLVRWMRLLSAIVVIARIWLVWRSTQKTNHGPSITALLFVFVLHDVSRSCTSRIGKTASVASWIRTLVLLLSIRRFSSPVAFWWWRGARYKEPDMEGMRCELSRFKFHTSKICLLRPLVPNPYLKTYNHLGLWLIHLI